MKFINNKGSFQTEENTVTYSSGLTGLQSPKMMSLHADMRTASTRTSSPTSASFSRSSSCNQGNGDNETHTM